MKQLNTDRYFEYLEQGRLLRGKWNSTDEEGRHTACMLAALAPNGETWNGPENCPANLLAPWFAELIPMIDDKGSDEAWPEMAKRMGHVLRGVYRLSAEDWDRLKFETLKIAVAEAKSHTSEARAIESCDHVLGLIERWLSGDKPSQQEWRDAADAAYAAAAAAAYAAADAAAYAADAAYAAVYDAAYAAAWDRMTDQILTQFERATDDKSGGQ